MLCRRSRSGVKWWRLLWSLRGHDAVTCDRDRQSLRAGRGLFAVTAFGGRPANSLVKAAEWPIQSHSSPFGAIRVRGAIGGLSVGTKWPVGRQQWAVLGLLRSRGLLRAKTGRRRGNSWPSGGFTTRMWPPNGLVLDEKRHARVRDAPATREGDEGFGRWSANAVVTPHIIWILRRSLRSQLN